MSYPENLLELNTPIAIAATKKGTDREKKKIKRESERKNNRTLEGTHFTNAGTFLTYFEKKLKVSNKEFSPHEKQLSATKSICYHTLIYKSKISFLSTGDELRSVFPSNILLADFYMIGTSAFYELIKLCSLGVLLSGTEPGNSRINTLNNLISFYLSGN